MTPHRDPFPHYPGTDRSTAEGRSELPDSACEVPGRRAFPMPDAESAVPAMPQSIAFTCAFG